jgi:co-chaperonin GroES (HSP10)
MAKKNFKNFRPNGLWLLLPDPTAKKTESGIYLDEDTARKSATNVLEVLEVGPNCKFVEKGDTVFIDPRPGSDAVVSEICGKSCILIMEHQVLGVLS